MKVLYTAEATATGGRDSGRSSTSDGAVDLPMAIPKELGGSGEGANPEQLFAAGYAACFHSALKLVAQRMEIDPAGSTITARVGLGALGGGRFGLEVELDAHVPAAEREQAEALIAKSHEVCPYSNATRGNIEVRLAVDGEPVAAPAVT